MTTMIVRSAETVHWYRKNGAPQYTVPAKDGSERPTTLRDARKMYLVPSVTTILKIASKPGLEMWKMEQMLLAALTLPKIPNEPEKAYLSRIVADSKETAKQAAELGTRIHESIEQRFAGQKTVEHQKSADAVEQTVNNIFPAQKWQVENSFAIELGFGGKVDLFAYPSESFPNGLVLDFKTKDFGPDDKVDAYDENLMQLSAYRVGLKMENAVCANVFVSRSHPGLVKIHFKFKNNFGD
jgi:hypothetical protein